MRCAFGKLCTGILIKATGLINCIVSTSFFPYICQLSLSTASGEEADLSSYGQSQKIKASSISWDGCEHSLQRGNTPMDIMDDLGSISSFTTLLAAESWIIKNPPEHGNTRSVGRETVKQYTQQSKVQGRNLKKKKKKLMHTGKSSQLSLSFSTANWQKQYNIYLLHFSFLRKLSP